MRYYFDIRDAEGLFPDEEGTELATLAAAQEQAAISLAGMARDAARTLHDGVPHTIGVEIRNKKGPVLHINLIIKVSLPEEGLSPAT